jgi:hypothetical protein
VLTHRQVEQLVAMYFERCGDRDQQVRDHDQRGHHRDQR